MIEPLLNKDKVKGGGLYFEYRTDDARLVIEIAKSAYEKGATLLNYAEIDHLIYNSEKQICGGEVI
ncbi:MAG: glycerol-3-phosphate dehydrogenase, partial [Baekduiaceae bacterium]